MNSAASAQVKGWCPGALRPMLSGDGLIVRIRPFCGAFSLKQARGLADLARRLGNGHIDLTRRANLQLRGLLDEHLPELHAELGKLGLLDPDAETEATRNLMVSPLAGLDPAESLDVRPIARAIADALAADERLRALPGKFGLLIDGGGTVSIAAERADVALLAVGAEIALGIDTPSGTQWLGATSPDAAAAAALLAVRTFLEAAGGARRTRMRSLSTAGVAHVRSVLMAMLRPCPVALPMTGRALGVIGTAAAVAAPFGRGEAEQLHRLGPRWPKRPAPRSCGCRRGGRSHLRHARRCRRCRDRRRSAGHWPDRRFARSAAAHRGLPWGARLQVEQRRCAGRCATAGSTGSGRGLRRQHPCLGLRQGLCAFRAVQAGAGRQGGSSWIAWARNATTRGPVERIIGAEEFPALFAGPRDG